MQVFQQFFLAPETPGHNLRRNVLTLYDGLRNETLKLDVTIGLSLMEKNEQARLTTRLERAHPHIPNAQVVPAQQIFSAPPRVESVLENVDPNQVIRDNTVKAAPAKHHDRPHPTQQQHHASKPRKASALHTSTSESVIAPP
jgi:hypothetical protein